MDIREESDNSDNPYSSQNSTKALKIVHGDSPEKSETATSIDLSQTNIEKDDQEVRDSLNLAVAKRFIRRATMWEDQHLSYYVLNNEIRKKLKIITDPSFFSQHSIKVEGKGNQSIVNVSYIVKSNFFQVMKDILSLNSQNRPLPIINQVTPYLAGLQFFKDRQLSLNTLSDVM